MRILKIFSVLLLTLGMIAFRGGNALLMAGQTDSPHQTHLELLRGPGMGGSGSPCINCHTSGTPGQGDVDFDTCNSCHSPGGAYDGVNDSNVGALNNWENLGDPADATQSLIYEADGKLKSGKDKWCASCHDGDTSEASTVLIDDFESYTDFSSLRVVWAKAQDARQRYLEPQRTGVTGPDGSQCMQVKLTWTYAPELYGSVNVTYTSALDLADMDAVNFYVKVSNPAMINKIKVQLRKAGTTTFCTAYVNGNDLYSCDDGWTKVTLPRASFNDTTWGLVDKFRLRILENDSGGNHIEYVYFDNIYFSKGGPNVVGDNQTFGYYVTGHKMYCTKCHDSTKPHIDGERLPVLEYINSTANPTNFRFYDDDTKQLTLPYAPIDGHGSYEPGTTGSFALCYWCHDESKLVSPGYETNFYDMSPASARCGMSPLMHKNHAADWANTSWGVSCVHCHDPHGQANPAMTRKEMGDSIAFDAIGCEIPLDADVDEDGVKDRYDPNINMGWALRVPISDSIDPSCSDCHQDVNPLINMSCDPCPVPIDSPRCLGDGFYLRDYRRLPHSGGGEVDESCGVAGCHDATQGSHATHTQGTAKGPDPLDCGDCHIDGAVEVGAMVSAGACDDCHSPGGAFDGVQMAKDNWDNVYESDGTTLQSGKGQWCATCHDDEPASSRPGPGIEVVVDNPAADFVCEWGTSSTGGYNGDYRWHEAGGGSCTATWTPDLPAAETYNVSAWWKASSNRATNAKYTIYYDGGSDTVEVNQQINGDKWNLLGTYPFAAGTSGYVVLSDDANAYVVADAIKLDNGSGEVSILAPNVIGDNVDYGFYVSGHNINCLSCHDAGKQHIDHEHRTYEVDDATYAAINPYGDSYRLQVASNKASSTLCFVCHNSTEVLGQNSSDVSHTNFWNNDANVENSHWLHVVAFTGIHFDSDWDGAIDSTESCITCHNVHGSPTQAMIRHGELISSYGTTDKVPALNFAYLVEPTEFDTATWTPDLAADTYSVYARWKASSNRATNATYTIYYSGGSDTVEVNQQINGDQWNLLGTYPFAAGTSGYVELTDEGADNFVIADAIGWDTDGGAPDVVVDDGDPEFATVGDWTCVSGSGGYGDDYCYAKAAPEPIPDAGVEDSVGGRMSYAGPGVGDNGVCWACHGAISYYRTPYLGPRVIMGQAAPDTVANDGSGTSLITVFVSDTSATGVPDVDTVEIDLTPIGGSANQLMSDDGGGYYSYEVTIPDGTPDSPLTFVITATDDDMNTGEGEAKLTVVDPDSIYVDDAEAAFVCDWGVSATGGYRDDYRWHAAGTGSCTATWTPDLPAADNYSVYAWWKASSNRATDAPYTIYYDGGSETVDVNQEANGSQWNLLGTFPFAAGTSGYVVLSDDANEYVIADAIKFEP